MIYGGGLVVGNGDLSILDNSALEKPSKNSK
jgi:hypothetical protein